MMKMMRETLSGVGGFMSSKRVAAAAGFAAAWTTACGVPFFKMAGVDLSDNLALDIIQSFLWFSAACLGITTIPGMFNKQAENGTPQVK